MNRRLVTILFLAFVIASACAFALWRLRGNLTASTRSGSTVRVVAASGDIKLGTILAASNLKTIEIAGALPKGAILKPEDAIGRGVVSDLYQGEPILESRLAAKGTGGGLASTIPQGMRACAVKVDDVVGVAGFATPGMRVDVLISGIPPTEQNVPNQSTVTRTILQNIQVLSAGTDYQKDSEGKPKPVQVVNLLVTPAQAESLSLASNAKVQLVLRNPLDTSMAEVPGAVMSNLFNGGKAPAQPAKLAVVAKVVRKTAPREFSIEVINGTKRSQEKFAAPEEKP